MADLWRMSETTFHGLLSTFKKKKNGWKDEKIFENDQKNYVDQLSDVRSTQKLFKIQNIKQSQFNPQTLDKVDGVIHEMVCKKLGLTLASTSNDTDLVIKREFFSRMSPAIKYKWKKLLLLNNVT